MSNTYFEATGLLHFRGPAKLTPVLRALFEPLNLDDDNIDTSSDARYIARTTSRAGDWADVLENLGDLADERGLPAVPPESPAEADDTTLGMRRVAAAHGVPDAELTSLLDAARTNDTAHLADLFKLAQLFNDGHNLRAITAEGCWHADRARLGEFGGYGVYKSEHVYSDMDSSQVVIDATELDAALDAGDHGAAVTLLTNQVARACRAVLDRETRVTITRLLLDRLVEDRSWQLT